MTAPAERRGAWALAAVGLCVGVTAAVLTWRWQVTARRSMALHDITTDTFDPPVYVALLASRGGATASAYGGPAEAEAQRAAFPDLEPFFSDRAPARLFDAASAAVRSLGWTVVAADAAKGRIEATDKSFWSGRSYDIVVRVRRDGRGSRLDVRCASRGEPGGARSSVRRVRGFLRRLHHLV